MVLVLVPETQRLFEIELNSMSWHLKTAEIYPPLTWTSSRSCRFWLSSSEQEVTRYPTKVMSSLSLTLPMSSRIRSHTQPDLAAPKMAEEGRVKRQRCPIPFFPTCTHNQAHASHALSLYPFSCFTDRWVENYRPMSSVGLRKCESTSNIRMQSTNKLCH